MKAFFALFVIFGGALALIAQAPAPQTPAKQASVAHAPATATTPKIDPAKEQDIRNLLELNGTKDLVMQVIDTGLQQMRTNFARTLPQNDRARQFTDAFALKFKTKLNADMFVDRVVPIYDKYFSEEDIKGLLKFYGTPLGQRTIQALPQITRESQAIGSELGKKAAGETMEELKSEYSDILSPEKPSPNKQ